MSKLEELEKDLTDLLEKFDIDEMCDTDAAELAKCTTTFWGIVKTAKQSSNVEPRR